MVEQQQQQMQKRPRGRPKRKFSADGCTDTHNKSSEAESRLNQAENTKECKLNSEANICMQAEYITNNALPETQKCGYKGVREKRRGKYAAEIGEPGKPGWVCLGTFNTAEDAARAYDKAAWRLRRSPAHFNFPQEWLKVRHRNHDHDLAASSQPWLSHILSEFPGFYQYVNLLRSPGIPNDVSSFPFLQQYVKMSQQSDPSPAKLGIVSFTDSTVISDHRQQNVKVGYNNNNTVLQSGYGVPSSYVTFPFPSRVTVHGQTQPWIFTATTSTT